MSCYIGWQKIWSCRGVTTITLLIAWLTGSATLAQQSFEDYHKQHDQEYEAYVRRQNEAFETYVKEVTAKWNEFKNSTRREWYQYSRDLNTLSKVDFEAGEVTIETILPEDNPNLMAQAEKNIADQVRRLQGADSLTGVQILQDQLEMPSGDKVDTALVEQFIREVVIPKMKAHLETLQSRDGVRRKRITTSFKLVPDHLRVRAQKYLPLVRKHCQRFSLEVPLIMAIIQTESYFNPRAKSPAPAYGLMQLVPKSGGRDAYRYVYKEDRIVTPSYLYVPENNVELGCAYLAKLRDNEFSGVVDPEKQRYCMITSYNTGPRNVCGAIVDSRNIGEAVVCINGMGANILFQTLVTNLPYDETRDYLQKVESRLVLYGKWRENER